MSCQVNWWVQSYRLFFCLPRRDRNPPGQRCYIAPICLESLSAMLAWGISLTVLSVFSFFLFLYRLPQEKPTWSTASASTQTQTLTSMLQRFTKSWARSCSVPVWASLSQKWPNSQSDAHGPTSWPCARRPCARVTCSTLTAREAKKTSPNPGTALRDRKARAECRSAVDLTSYVCFFVVSAVVLTSCFFSLVWL